MTREVVVVGGGMCLNGQCVVVEWQWPSTGASVNVAPGEEKSLCPGAGGGRGGPGGKGPSGLWVRGRGIRPGVELGSWAWGGPSGRERLFEEEAAMEAGLCCCFPECL